jgi:hypothetical protein
MLLNYPSYLEEHHYFDDSFRVYEKAVILFVYPQLQVIWNTYIEKFMARYEGSKIELLGDMFENAVSKVWDLTTCSMCGCHLVRNVLPLGTGGVCARALHQIRENGGRAWPYAVSQNLFLHTSLLQ